MEDDEYYKQIESDYEDYISEQFELYVIDAHIESIKKLIKNAKGDDTQINEFKKILEKLQKKKKENQ